ncbi:hypothetical protein Hanom_Chr10g00925871 [Helianthus anomalus]
MSIFTLSHPLTYAYSFPYLDIRAKFRPCCRVCDGQFILIYGFTNAINAHEHPKLLQYCPFQDKGDNLLKRHMSNQHELIGNSKQRDGEMLTHASHQHPLNLFEKQTRVGVSLHDHLKRTQLLCDECVKPIMTVPFYTCCQYDDEQYCFVLPQGCAKLPPS